jgi:hypothetical protein
MSPIDCTCPRQKRIQRHAIVEVELEKDERALVWPVRVEPPTFHFEYSQAAQMVEQAEIKSCVSEMQNYCHQGRLQQ